MALSFTVWVARAENTWIDRDGYPPGGNIYQCHDVWLDYINRVYDLPISAGHAGGATSRVYTEFPRVAILSNYFTRVGPGTAQPGDVAFWPSPHVAVVIADAGASLITLSQNNGGDSRPMKTLRTTLSKNGLLGYLRPKTTLTAAALSLVQKEEDMSLPRLYRNTATGTIAAACIATGFYWDIPNLAAVTLLRSKKLAVDEANVELNAEQWEFLLQLLAVARATTS
ncbi:hypothetical protein GCM10022198_02590 [Klugiella xanthotipulae]|uniref:CHAP domain-containing protein n=1 Tax=Klugiella xanthotipulae TaxID=244735 RepID=A0A543I4T0_9MICO|nr:CHAP domain-containing protein [Klugiella xanthotipulae]TQM65606.1 hypothetical protein FB466_0412 [Klugiella xanthotipulae]